MNPNYNYNYMNNNANGYNNMQPNMHPGYYNNNNYNNNIQPPNMNPGYYNNMQPQNISPGYYNNINNNIHPPNMNINIALNNNHKQALIQIFDRYGDRSKIQVVEQIITAFCSQNKIQLDYNKLKYFTSRYNEYINKTDFINILNNIN